MYDNKGGTVERRNENENGNSKKRQKKGNSNSSPLEVSQHHGEDYKNLFTKPTASPTNSLLKSIKRKTYP